MADPGALAELQRELGMAAARSEQGRQEAERALEAERRRAQELERQVAAAHTSSREQLGLLQVEVGELRRALVQAQDEAQQVPQLHADLSRLRQQLAEAHAVVVAERERANAERQHVAQELADLRERAPTMQGEVRAKAEAAKMRRELKGMNVLVGTLRKKLEVYEQRLLEQARNCADELNDMKWSLASRETSLGAEGTDAADSLSDEGSDERSPGAALKGLGLGLGSAWSLAPPLQPHWPRARTEAEAEETVYMRLDADDDDGPFVRPSPRRSPFGPDVQRPQPLCASLADSPRGRSYQAPKYMPPILPDAI